MASSTAASNTAGTRRVLCETADGQQIPVEVDVMRVLRVFATMYDDLSIGEQADFPGIFPVKNVDMRVFVRVIDWCKEHKGLADPIVKKDILTQEEKWFNFSDFERQFLDVPVPELLELIEAADFLDIRSLYEYGCQAIAALIKGKRQFEVRQILQQSGDLSAEDIDEIFARSPWLESLYKFKQTSDRTLRCDGSCLYQVTNWRSRLETENEFRKVVDIPEPILIPDKVLVKVFLKLPRWDTERFQLVSRYFRDVIDEYSEHELSEKRGPLRPVHVALGASLQGKHVVTAVDDFSRVICLEQDGYIVPTHIDFNCRVTCLDRDSLGKCLKFSTVERLKINCVQDEICGELLASIVPLKQKWKNATAEVPLYCFSSKTDLEFALTELFMCKEINLQGEARFDPRPWMRLLAFLQCSKLNIRHLGWTAPEHYDVTVNDVIEWVEREKPELWEEPAYLELDHEQVIGGFAGLVDALKEAFLEADRPNPYTVRISYWSRDSYPKYDELHRNEKTKEQMTVKSCVWEADWYISMERKKTELITC